MIRARVFQSRLPIIVDACTRNGRGGSPTALLLDDDTFTDDGRRDIVRRAGTSHAAFVGGERAQNPAGGRASRPVEVAEVPQVADVVSVRFFTSRGELKNCGHATIAVHAWLLDRSGDSQRRSRQQTGGRTFDVTAVRRPGGSPATTTGTAIATPTGTGTGTAIEVWFDQGPVELHEIPATARDAVLESLGVAPHDTAPDAAPCIASPGTPRLLVPVIDRRILFALRPDFDRLAAQCRRLGLLGCFVYVPPSVDERAAGRMFAPAVGVREDVVNANSAGCLAAYLLATRGVSTVQVEQGDALGRPSLVLATAARSAEPGGNIVTRVGGTAEPGGHIVTRVSGTADGGAAVGTVCRTTDGTASSVRNTEA